MLAIAGCDQVFGLDDPLDGVDDHDEDVDGVSNGRDNCPTIVNADQKDDDGDDVGDICDPRPMTPGDRIAVRYFFDSPADDPAAWYSTGWTFADGYVEQPLLEQVAQLVANQTLDVAALTVEVEYVVTGFSPSPFGNELGIMLEGGNGHQCYVQLQGPDLTRLQVRAAGSVEMGPFLPMPVIGGVPFRLVASVERATGAVECRIGRSRATDAGTAAPGPIGVYTSGNAAQVRYVVVYVVD